MMNSKNILFSQDVICEKGKYGFICDKGFVLNVLYRSPLPENETHEWAFSMDFLEFLSDEGVEDIMVIDVEKGQIIKTTMLEFQKNGVPHIHPKHGHQLYLPKSFWKTLFSETVEK